MDFLLDNSSVNTKYALLATEYRIANTLIHVYYYFMKLSSSLLHSQKKLLHLAEMTFCSFQLARFVHHPTLLFFYFHFLLHEEYFSILNWDHDRFLNRDGTTSTTTTMTTSCNKLDKIFTDIMKKNFLYSKLWRKTLQRKKRIKVIIFNL